MQTFVPHPDVWASAATLDQRRLGKQRVETMQIIRALTRPGYGWQNHPAVRMWAGHVPFLWRYQVAVCTTWINGGRADSCLAKTAADLTAARITVTDQTPPPWWGDPAVHASHRSRLIEKDPDHYGPLFPDDRPGLPYVWPTSTRSA